MPETLDQVKLTEAFQAAKKAVEEMEPIEDGGTCNMDTAVIYCPGRMRKRLYAAADAAGVRVGEPMSGLWKNCHFIWLGTGAGQAYARTKAVEKVRDVIKDYGFETMVWYQAD